MKQSVTHILFVMSIDSLKHQRSMCWDETTPDYTLLTPAPLQYSTIYPSTTIIEEKKYNNSRTFSSYRISLASYLKEEKI